MKSIGLRLFWAFCCIIVFLLLQGYYAHDSFLKAEQIQRMSSDEEARLQNIREKIDLNNLLIHTILGSQDPDIMDSLNTLFTKNSILIHKLLNADTLKADLHDSLVVIYREIVALHYNFATKMGKTKLQQRGTPVYKQLVSYLSDEKSKRKVLSKKNIQGERERNSWYSFLLTTLALTTALIWALLLKRTLVDKKKSDHLIKESEKRFSAVFNYSNDPIFIIDRELCIIESNLRAETFFKLSRNSLNNMLFSGLVKEMNNMNFKKLVLRLENMKESQEELVLVDSSSKEFICDCTFSPFRIETEDYIQCVIRDITERKNKDIELQHYRENLESLVEERTNALKKVQDELLYKAHQAGMADIATGTLHNIGNILNSVKVATERSQDILKQRQTYEKIKRVNSTLQKGIIRFREFISDDIKGEKFIQYHQLLEEASYTESEILEKLLYRVGEKVTLIEEVLLAQQGYVNTIKFASTINITELVQDALTIHHGQLSSSHILVENDLNFDIPHIKAQKIKMMYVLTNILKNAIESVETVEEERRLIHIGADYESLDNDLILTLHDSGSGIANEILSQIFVHGFTTKLEHNGFSLHNCANYMTEMSGRIWCKSDGENQGATFYLKIPLANAS